MILSIWTEMKQLGLLGGTRSPYHRTTRATSFLAVLSRMVKFDSVFANAYWDRGMCNMASLLIIIIHLAPRKQNLSALRSLGSPCVNCQ